MFEFYNRRGELIDLEQWSLLHRDWEKNFRVAETEVITPSGATVNVSTVLLGLNHNYVDGAPPLIFETMAFANSDTDTPVDHETRRYTTEAEALAGHAEAVKWLSEFGTEPVADHTHVTAAQEEVTAEVDSTET